MTQIIEKIWKKIGLKIINLVKVKNKLFDDNYERDTVHASLSKMSYSPIY